MEYDSLWEKLFNDRDLSFELSDDLVLANKDDMLESFDGDMDKYFGYLNSFNKQVEKSLKYKIELYMSDCLAMRKYFLMRKLNEIYTKEGLISIYALFLHIQYYQLDVIKFITIMDRSLHWNDNIYTRVLYKYNDFDNLEAIKDVDILRSYIHKIFEK